MGPFVGFLFKPQKMLHRQKK